jgi:D-alanyl-D-alanine carboxypeptidase
MLSVFLLSKWRERAALAIAGESVEQSFKPDVQMKLDSTLTQVMSEHKIPGVVLGLWIPGAGTWITARGMSNLATNAPMNNVDNHFRIGSITKTFTVTALLQLADDKTLTLDDLISHYLPFVPDGEKITLRMLANMTSGLYSYTFDDAWVKELLENPERVWTPRELVDVAFKHPLNFTPGTQWEYSNTNTVLLGMVIEKVTGQQMAEVFRQRIFEPLGLSQTSWPTSSAMPEPFPHGYSEQTLDGKQADVTFRNPSWAWGVGNLISTLADLKIYAKAIATGERLISKDMQAQRLTWVTLPPNTATKKYGLGIGDASGWLGHTGGLPGYNVTMYYLPPKDATIVVMVNSDISTNDVGPASAITDALIKIVTPENAPD